jgi:hypothetical protein
MNDLVALPLLLFLQFDRLRTAKGYDMAEHGYVLDRGLPLRVGIFAVAS